MSSRKRVRSEDDVGSGGTGGAGPPQPAFSWASVAASLPSANAPAPGPAPDPDPSRFNYMHDRTKIRNQHGRREVASWPRNNLFLFLGNLPSASGKWYQNQAYTAAAIQAIRDATEGPDGIMDLTSLGARGGLGRVLGNAPAGQIFEDIRERSRQVAAASVRDSREVREIPQLYRSLPVNLRLDNAVSRNLLKVAPQGTGTVWVWDLLRQAMRTGWDIRYRALREGTLYDSDGKRRSVIPFEELPPYVAFHGDQINGMAHGGDLRLDALLCQLEYSSDRYGSPDYIAYLERMFRHLYGMDSNVAIWLCKSLPSSYNYAYGSIGAVPKELYHVNMAVAKSAEHGRTHRHGVDWPRLIMTINL